MVNLWHWEIEDVFLENLFVFVQQAKQSVQTWGSANSKIETANPHEKGWFLGWNCTKLTWWTNGDGTGKEWTRHHGAAEISQITGFNPTNSRTWSKQPGVHWVSPPEQPITYIALAILDPLQAMSLTMCICTCKYT